VRTSIILLSQFLLFQDWSTVFLLLKILQRLDVIAILMQFFPVYKAIEVVLYAQFSLDR
jgi:hypothetical protein